MIDTLITSKTRIKLLLKFFLNANSSSYLRALAQEFNESSNAIRLELNRFEDAGLLSSHTESNKKFFKANKKHPLFGDIHNILLKYVGIDKIIDQIVEKIGDIKEVYLTGDFAKGKDCGIIDIVIVSEGLDRSFLLKLVDKVENMIKRKIRYLILNTNEAKDYKERMVIEELLLIWEQGG